MRRSTVLDLSLQRGFPAFSRQIVIFCTIWIDTDIKINNVAVAVSSSASISF